MLGDVQDVPLVEIDGREVRTDPGSLVRDLELRHWP